MKKTISIVFIAAMLLSMLLVAIPVGAAEEELTLPVTTWEKPWTTDSSWVEIKDANDLRTKFVRGTSSTDVKKYYLTGDVVIDNSFNTTVENWSDDDIATGEIDFGNIQKVDIACREMTYRIEEREEFDIVMTNFLTEQDGWQHYETKTVEYEVPNGYEYTFLIYYKNGRKEKREYHEASPIADMLIEISEQH